MIREQKNRRIFVHIGLVVLLSVCAILVFLFSIKGLLLSESKQRLIELNGRSIKILEEFASDNTLGTNVQQEIVSLNDNNRENYFDSRVYSYILDNQYHVIAMFGDKGKELLTKNHNALGDFQEGLNSVLFRQKLIQEGCQVVLYQMPDGESVYAAVDQTISIPNGIVITIVSKKLVMDEINSIYNIAIVIVVLALIALILAVIYNCYKQRSAKRKDKKSGRPDKVTGLMQYSIHKAIAQKYINSEKYVYAYVSFSIDKYTLISELNGKTYCENLLKGVASIVSEWIHEDETFARNEDDLFGMLLIYDDELKFRQRLIRILKHAGDIPLDGNNFCNITFHSGVCVVGKETDIDRVVSRAQKARVGNGVQTIGNINFYQNKASKGNGHNKIAEDVSDAICKDEFLIYLQPKYQIESEKIVGAEALVRWNHPQNGMLYPNVFLPLLEESGMVTQLDMHVLEKVCEYMKKWIEEGKMVVPVSINLSAKHLEEPAFLKNLLNIVDCCQIPHQLIELEFPEKAVYEMQQTLTQVMQELAKLDFTLSIDNFGKGHSAIHLLNQLPIKLIKIDKDLIKDFEDAEFSDKDRMIVRHIISYAKEKNVEVVAEGVETKGQRDLLLEQQCDIIQGFYYQKPMPVKEFEKLLV